MGGVLNVGFEEEVVCDFGFGFDEFHEGLRFFDFWQFFQQIFSPFDEDSAYGAGVELGLSVFDDLSYFGTGEHVLSQDVLHILFEGVLFFDGLLEQKVDVFVDGLYVVVGGVGEGLAGEVVEQVHVGFGAGDVGELDFFSLGCLGVAFFEFAEDAEEGVVGVLHDLDQGGTVFDVAEGGDVSQHTQVVQGAEVAQTCVYVLFEFVQFEHVLFCDFPSDDLLGDVEVEEVVVCDFPDVEDGALHPGGLQGFEVGEGVERLASYVSPVVLKKQVLKNLTTSDARFGTEFTEGTLVAKMMVEEVVSEGDVVLEDLARRTSFLRRLSCALGFGGPGLLL